jgi:hypothetical protein
MHADTQVDSYAGFRSQSKIPGAVMWVASVTLGTGTETGDN